MRKKFFGQPEIEGGVAVYLSRCVRRYDLPHTLSCHNVAYTAAVAAYVIAAAVTLQHLSFAAVLGGAGVLAIASQWVFLAAGGTLRTRSPKHEASRLLAAARKHVGVPVAAAAESATSNVLFTFAVLTAVAEVGKVVPAALFFASVFIAAVFHKTAARLF
jgi:hypothetical protein